MDYTNAFDGNGMRHLTTLDAPYPHVPEPQYRLRRAYIEGQWDTTSIEDLENATRLVEAKVFSDAISVEKCAKYLARNDENQKRQDEPPKKTNSHPESKFDIDSRNEPANIPLPKSAHSSFSNSSRESNVSGSDGADEEFYISAPLNAHTAMGLIPFYHYHVLPTDDSHYNTDINSPAIDPSDRAWSPPDPRAETHLDHFFKHYFLSDDPTGPLWTPDRAKTPSPIILHGAVKHSLVHSKAGRVPGLEACSAGAPPHRAIVLGWDRLAVWTLASQVGTVSYPATSCRYIFEAARRFGRAMEGHHDVLKLGKAEHWMENENNGVPDHFQGSYLVRWRDDDGGWDVRAVLRLDIGQGPRKNILQGKVRLARHKDVLDAYMDMTGRVEDEPEEAATLESEECEESGEEAELGTMRKPIEITFSLVTELFYRTVSRATGQNKGVIRFKPDQTFTSFWGEGYLPYVKNRFEMEGFEC